MKETGEDAMLWRTSVNIVLFRSSLQCSYMFSAPLCESASLWSDKTHSFQQPCSPSGLSPLSHTHFKHVSSISLQCSTESHVKEPGSVEHQQQRWEWIDWIHLSNPTQSWSRIEFLVLAFQSFLVHLHNFPTNRAEWQPDLPSRLKSICGGPVRVSHEEIASLHRCNRSRGSEVNQYVYLNKYILYIRIYIIYIYTPLENPVNQILSSIVIVQHVFDSPIGLGSSH